MRLLPFIVLQLLMLDLYAQVSFGRLDCLSNCEKQHAKYQYSQGRERDVDMIYTQFNWRLNPEQQFINGEVFIRFNHLNEQQQISLDLLDNLTVSRVLYHGDSTSFSHNNDVLAINLPQLTQGLDSISISYFGSPFTEGLGTFTTDTTSAGEPVLWTLSQPYGAPGWWPCNNALGERVDSMDLFINVPAGYTAASHGILKSETPQGNTVQYHWSHRHSIPPYLVAVAVGKYTLIEEQIPVRGDSLLVQHFLYPEWVEPYRQDWERTGDMIQFYDSLLGPYPYMDEKYGHAMFTRGGGMEHNTISFMYDFFPELLAHELIHHWVGNRITCASWQELWLNEGITTYLSSFVYERYYDRDYYPDWKRAVKRRVFEVPEGIIFAEDTSDVEVLFDSRLRYIKPASILNMLRANLGDSSFFAGMYNYINDSSLINGFVTSQDFIAHMEAASGEELHDFFDQWIYQPGFPKLSINYESTGDFVFVNWKQESSANNGYNFDFNVLLALYQNEVPTYVNLPVKGASGGFTYKISGDLDSLVLDPFDNVPVFEEAITRTIKGELTVFPNPTSQEVTIQLPALEQITSYTVVNDLGAEVQSSTEVRNSYVKLDVRQLSKGTYHLNVKNSAGKHYTSTFVVYR